MSYLSRPVFTFKFNWAEALKKSFEFDLRALQIGFSVSEVYAPQQLHVVRGWECSVQLPTAADIDAIDTFLNTLLGPLKGFWLPTSQAELTIKAVVDGTHFDIVAQDLVSTWSGHPAIYLQFRLLDDTTVFAKITAVSTINSTTERVTVDADLSSVVTTGNLPMLMVSRILYVRLAGDDEDVEFLMENFARRTLRLIELPTEYVDWETGARPVFLYHFYVKFPTTTDHWYYTSFAQTVTAGGNDYASAPISHGDLKTGIRSDTEQLEIDSFMFDGNPLSQFVPFTLPFPLQVEVFETSLPNLGTPAKMFGGSVQSVAAKGKKLTATCVSIIDAFERRLPRHLFQTRCNYGVFDPSTCKLSPSAFQIGATISAIDPDDATIVTISSSSLANNVPGGSAPPPDHWFSEGTINVGTGTSEEIRSVKDSAVVDSTHHTLTLTRPLFLNTTGASLVALPGCDHRNTTCQQKFNNYVNFGGHPYLPTDNQIAHVANVNPAPSTKK